MKRLKWITISLLTALVALSCAIPAALTAGSGFSSAPGGQANDPSSSVAHLPTLSAAQLAHAPGAAAPTPTPAAGGSAGSDSATAAAPTAAPAEPAKKTALAATPAAKQAAAPAGCAVSQGVLYLDTLRVNKTGRPLDYQVYVPPCYPKPGVRYPVLYLFHGQTSGRDQWARIGLADAMDKLIDAGQIPPFIVVMPQEYYYLQDMDKSQFDSAVMTDLIPLIDRIFPTCTERDCRAVGGISRGALWATMLGWRDWLSFGAVGLFGFPGNPLDVNEELGDVRDMGPDRLPRIYMDSGNTDDYLSGAQTYSSLLDAYKVPHEWHSDPGGHVESYWSRHLEAYLLWFAEDWK